MIDIHNHIIYDIDDGARNIDNSVMLCRDAFENGYKALVATPHFTKYNQIDEFVTERDYKIEKLREILKQENIELDIFAGAELFLCDQLLKSDNLDELTINNSQYILCEFPLGPFNINRGLMWIDELIDRGYTPILAHPERYYEIHENLHILDELIERDIVFQVNIDSITGKNGKTAQQLAIDLVNRGFAQLVATDAHDLRYRHTRIKEKIEELPYEIDYDTFMKCIKENPQKIINDKKI